MGRARRAQARAPGAPCLGEPAREHRRRLDPRPRRVLDHAGHGGRRRDHDREVDLPLELREAPGHLAPEHLAVLEVDGVEPAGKPALGEVLPDDPAERALALGGADQRDAARGEQRLQVVARHPVQSKGLLTCIKPPGSSRRKMTAGT